MKKIFTYIISIIMVVLFVVPTYAADYISDKNICLVDINEADVPEGIIPMEFRSEEEAIEYIRGWHEQSQINRNNLLNTADLTEITTTATGTIVKNFLVDSYDVGVGKINLLLNYTTSGDNHTGIIQDPYAYTQFTGWTVSYKWTPSVCEAVIMNSNKDIYAYATGVLEWYLHLPTGVKVYNERVSLNGTVPAIH